MKKDEKQDKKKKNSREMYKPMTDQEVKLLADDMYKGLVFTNRHIQAKEDIQRVFMPLVLMGKELSDGLQENPPGMIYEYMDKAGPMAINGMPTFASFKMISMDDMKRVIICYKAIKDAVENV